MRNQLLTLALWVVAFLLSVSAAAAAPMPMSYVSAAKAGQAAGREGSGGGAAVGRRPQHQKKEPRRNLRGAAGSQGQGRQQQHVRSANHGQQSGERNKATASGGPETRSSFLSKVVVFAVAAVGLVSGSFAIPLISQYATADDVPSSIYKDKGTLTGRVVRVTDGDTVRVRHIPFLALTEKRRSGQVPRLSNGRKEKLTESTIAIRVYGIDCPETAKFGNPGQPFADEATDFVKSVMDQKVVKIKMMSKDQYGRAVAKVSYGSWPFRHDLSIELLKRGLAVVYRAGGAQYDGNLEDFNKAETRSKEKKVGLWGVQGGNAQTPADYKRLQNANEQQHAGAGGGGARGGGGGRGHAQYQEQRHQQGYQQQGRQGQHGGGGGNYHHQAGHGRGQQHHGGGGNQNQNQNQNNRQYENHYGGGNQHRGGGGGRKQQHHGQQNQQYRGGNSRV